MSEAGRAKALAAIDDEGLQYFNWYDSGRRRPYEVGIVPVEGGWLVYVTDERAGWDDYNPTVHAEEDEALDDFLDRLRDLNVVVEHLAEDGPLQG